MTLNLDHIPYEELNRFYAEVVSGMHVSLQPLATDFRILRHEAVERHAENIAQELYQPQYSYVPWMVSEYFDIPPDLLLKIGKAWWLTIIDIVVTDQMIDRQVPEIATIPLMLQHLRIQAERCYLDAFGNSELFWRAYASSFAGIWNALAHETYCVDAHQQVYTFEEMKGVCKSRSDLINTIVMMMGEVSGQTQAVAAISTFYENLTFADQLLDDASDWKADFATGRCTLPVVMALAKENIPLSDIKQVTLDDCALWMDRHRIRVQLSEHAIALLQEVENALSNVSPADSRLHEVLRQRMKVARHANKRYRTMRLMTGFIQKLESSGTEVAGAMSNP